MMAQALVTESGNGGAESPAGNRRTGRREAFEEMYETHMPKVYRYVSYRTGNASIAEDITSDVFEKALKHFDSYQQEKASQSTWLMTIARNTITDHFRREGRVQVVREEDAPEEVSEEPDAQDQVARLEEVRQLRLCLAGLPQLDQDIISLKFGAGMNNREIARTLKVSESNGGTRLYRAVRRLRDAFKGWEHDTQG
jgi:RNA polymerase sigma-70 factor (ECF subfamily)